MSEKDIKKDAEKVKEKEEELKQDKENASGDDKTEGDIQDTFE